MYQDIRYLFFDVGDTLRVTKKIPEHRYAAKCRVAELLGTSMDPAAFADLIDERYAVYRHDATISFVESPEEDLWTKWLAPDFPEELVRSLAVELTFLFRQFRGRRELAPNAMEMIQGLTARGYKLGIISNVITSQELHDWLIEDGLVPYFHPVVLSSLTGIRKPDPKIFELALNEANIDARHCAYVGDNIERDIGGAKAVGFGMTVLIDLKRSIDISTLPAALRPDAVVYQAPDLLELFPCAPTVNEHAASLL